MTQEMLPFPKILSKVVDNATEESNRLDALQKQLYNEVLESSLEIMQFLGIEPSDGWRVDLDSKRFVKVVEEEAEEAPEPDEPDSLDD